MESSSNARRTLPTPAETLAEIRTKVGTTLDLTDRGTREAVYAILTRTCPTNDPSGRITGEKIQAPPANILAAQLRRLLAEVGEA